MRAFIFIMALWMAFDFMSFSYAYTRITVDAQCKEIQKPFGGVGPLAPPWPPYYINTRQWPVVKMEFFEFPYGCEEDIKKGAGGKGYPPPM
jgi:hypothetical protein